jgi:hypothetical protein
MLQRINIMREIVQRPDHGLVLSGAPVVLATLTEPTGLLSR